MGATPRRRGLTSVCAVLAAASMLACADEDPVAAVASPEATAFLREAASVIPSSEGPTVPPSEAVKAALTEAMRRASAAVSGDHAITVELMRDALLRDPASSASRALTACGSSWRPPPLDASALEVRSNSFNSFQVLRLELGTATMHAFGADAPVTTGAYLHAILKASSETADGLGVTPEAHLACLETVHAEAPEV